MSAVNSKQRQFDALVRSLSGDLFRYAYWLCGDEALANDLVQETFLRAWRALGDLRETNAAKAWLMKPLSPMRSPRTPSLNSHTASRSSAFAAMAVAATISPEAVITTSPLKPK